jgi:hypothetical protein
MFLEYPKMIYGPNGEEVVVEDEAGELAQLAEWAGDVPEEANEPAVIRRGPGRPRKVA